MTQNKIPLDRFLPHLLRRITTSLNTDMTRDLKNYGINVSRWRVISVLQSCQGCSIGDLAKKTALTQPGTSQVIDQLAAEDIVSRRPQKQDNRITELTLTPKGHSLFNEIYPIVENHHDHLISDFSDEEKKIIIKLSQRMLANIE